MGRVGQTENSVPAAAVETGSVHVRVCVCQADRTQHLAGLPKSGAVLSRRLSFSPSGF